MYDPEDLREVSVRPASPEKEAHVAGVTLTVVVGTDVTRLGRSPFNLRKDKGGDPGTLH